MYINSPIKKYLKDLAAKMPAPGGGSAAALSSALAASLVCMASQFTLSKEKYAVFAPRAKKILAASSRMQTKLSALLDEDVSAYMNKDMKKAIEVPAQVCCLSLELMGFAIELLERGNKNLATDAGLAVLLSESGFHAGISYVRVNLKCLKERAYKYRYLLKKLNAYAKKIKVLRKKAEVIVGYSFGW
ncbi:MAG: hypothetical protein AUJ74_06755 [Candidatus Omnitrophica bacterium CG1_02_44_16]|nr:MAG: hypothetical protein AUJ74_06755 [Candidatus Omnitrophica bacterium CG1_02_44_16]PIY84015.1 MAG: hypothetical protein COY78_00160 [Candidatus Omnitrophica bacterium CG_4_10_14_0_8_um_filter_44_12]PIZ84959.1 MAG: hypothetical protein COX96_01135 [Candidatus Omnitrophica bacterium CG_4_10_14_0_2_um_filter_44_9]